MTKELYEKFKIGDSLSDKELAELTKFFKRLSDDLKLLGEEYNLAWYPIYQNFLICENFQYHRRLK